MNRPASIIVLSLCAGLALTPSALADDAKEVTNVRVVVNLLKGLSGTEEECKQAAKDMVKKINEIYKAQKVCVQLTLADGDIKTGVEIGDGDADLETNEEMEKAKTEGLKEVTGEGKSGVKITMANSLQWDYGGTTGVIPGIGFAWKCQPYAAVDKGASANSSDGATAAHELGHALGKLDDLSGAENKKKLMYESDCGGEEIPEDDAKKIRDGAKKVGETVKEGATKDEPKKRMESGRGTGNGPIGPDNDNNSIPDNVQNQGGAPATAFSLTQAPNDEIPIEIRPMSLEAAFPINAEFPMQRFMHVGLDLDANPDTGADIGLFQGVERIVSIQRDPFGNFAQGIVVDPGNGNTWPLPVEIMLHEVCADPRDEHTPGHIGPGMDVGLNAVIDPLALGFIFPGPASLVRVIDSSSPVPQPFLLPGDSFFDVFYNVELDVLGPGIRLDRGRALANQFVQVEGFNMPPLTTVELRINEDPVGEATTDGAGEFDVPLLLVPSSYGADGLGLDTVKAVLPDGQSAMSWLETCLADQNNDGVLNVFDFLSFQTHFSEQDHRADLAAPAGVFNVFDFLEFQTRFSEGC